MIRELSRDVIQFITVNGCCCQRRFYLTSFVPKEWINRLDKSLYAAWNKTRSDGSTLGANHSPLVQSCQPAGTISRNIAVSA
jgi:hypothetical protein